MMRHEVIRVGVADAAHLQHDRDLRAAIHAGEGLLRRLLSQQQSFGMHSSVPLCQWPLNTSVLIGNSSAWIRSSSACTSPVASTACRRKPFKVPVFGSAMRSWLLV